MSRYSLKDKVQSATSRLLSSPNSPTDKSPVTHSLITPLSVRISRLSNKDTEQLPTLKTTEPVPMDKILEKVEGMIPIPKALWDELRTGDYIKYVDIDGKFHHGGYVRNVYNNKDGTKYIAMEAALSSRNKAYQFSARLDRITSIYKRPSVDYVLLSIEIMKLKKEVTEISALAFRK